MSDPIRAAVIADLRKALDRKLSAIQNAVSEEVNAGAFAIQGTAKKSILAGGNGAVVRRRGQDIQISAPGDPPANDLGTLQASIMVRRGSSGKVCTAYVDSTAEYSKALEFGTANMAARPFMQPALDANTKTINERIKAAVARAEQA